jgi:hypothetical protein
MHGRLVRNRRVVLSEAARTRLRLLFRRLTAGHHQGSAQILDRAVPSQQLLAMALRHRMQTAVQPLRQPRIVQLLHVVDGGARAIVQRVEHAAQRASANCHTRCCCSERGSLWRHHGRGERLQRTRRELQASRAATTCGASIPARSHRTSEEEDAYEARLGQARAWKNFALYRYLNTTL